MPQFRPQMFSAKSLTARALIGFIADAAECCVSPTVRLRSGALVKGDFIYFDGDKVRLGYYLVKKSQVAVPLEDIVWFKVRRGWIPERVYSADGQPFYNGYCWQNSGVIVSEEGHCMNPDCVDPHAVRAEREDMQRIYGLSFVPMGKCWGNDTKRVRCTCGWMVGLT